jgi:integration host factor subunit beta
METIVSLTRSELAWEVAQALEVPLVEGAGIVELIFDVMVRAIRSGEKVEIRRFGSFRTRQRRSRVGRNPKTGAKVNVPAKKIPYFKPSRELLAHLAELMGQK